ncbi:MAG: trimeric intracellular cation channel family protein [Acidobacteria bacterium]|nr:MAG: trimeric intracellular cation channel family protein [Acidobacteriota bacterium]
MALTAYLDDFVALLTYLAVVSSAVSGALEARQREMDVVGAVSVAFVTAFGGGTLRDMLLGRTPIFWLLDPWLTVAAFATALVSYYSVRRVSDRPLLVADALGLGLFSTLGATYALQVNLSMLVAVLMGVVTGVFGGVLRDTICNRVPAVFRRNTELYATCSFVGVWVFVILMRLTPDATLAAWAGTATVVVLRLISVRFRLRLPEPRAVEEQRAGPAGE